MNVSDIGDNSQRVGDGSDNSGVSRSSSLDDWTLLSERHRSSEGSSARRRRTVGADSASPELRAASRGQSMEIAASDPFAVVTPTAVAAEAVATGGIKSEVLGYFANDPPPRPRLTGSSNSPLPALRTTSHRPSRGKAGRESSAPVRSIAAAAVAAGEAESMTVIDFNDSPPPRQEARPALPAEPDAPTNTVAVVELSPRLAIIGKDDDRATGEAGPSRRDVSEEMR